MLSRLVAATDDSINSHKPRIDNASFYKARVLFYKLELYLTSSYEVALDD